MDNVSQSELRGIHPLVDVVLKERDITLRRIEESERMMFRFISVVVAPFAALIGYAVLNFESRAKYVLLVVPFFACVALLIMGLFYIHQNLGCAYNKYLKDRANFYLGQEVIKLEDLDYYYYNKGLGIAQALAGIAFMLVTVSFMVLVPLIQQSLESALASSHVNQIVQRYGEASYWIVVAYSVLLTLTASYNQFGPKLRYLKENMNEF